MNKITTILLIIFLYGCSNTFNDDRYKMLLGKRCTQDGTKFSYVWFHSIYGEEQVKKEWCNDGKR